MTDRRKRSRLAGFLYLVVVVTGLFSLAYVPDRLIVWNNAAQTFGNLLTNEALFRYSLASSVICYVTFIFLALCLRHLLQPTNSFSADSMAALVLVSAAISLLNLTHKYTILDLIEKAKQQPTQSLPELQNQAMFYLDQYNNGIFIATIFWGLWLFPFGYLVYKSGFLPKILGILLMLGCFGYVIPFFGKTISANFGTSLLNQYLKPLPAIAEISACFWLLIVGAKRNTNS